MTRKSENKQAEISGPSATPDVAAANERAVEHAEVRQAVRSGNVAADEDGHVVLADEPGVNPTQDTSGPEVSVAEASAANMARLAKGDEPVVDNVASDDPHAGSAPSPKNTEDILPTPKDQDERIEQVPQLTPNAVTAVPSKKAD